MTSCEMEQIVSAMKVLSAATTHELLDWARRKAHDFLIFPAFRKFRCSAFNRVPIIIAYIAGKDLTRLA